MSRAAPALVRFTGFCLQGYPQLWLRRAAATGRRVGAFVAWRGLVHL